MAKRMRMFSGKKAAGRKPAYKKRAFKKRRGVTKNKRSVALGKGLPKKIIMTHKYREVIEWADGAGGAQQVYNFSCNGMYDPNITGTGHQPLYFDQMTPIYNYYTVVGAKCTWRVLNKSGTLLKLATQIDHNSTPVASETSAIAEQTSGILKILPAANVDSKPSVFTQKFSAKTRFGGDIMGNDDLKGTSSTNPLGDAYFQLCAQAVDLDTAWSVVLDVQIEYIAVWTDIKDIAQS